MSRSAYVQDVLSRFADTVGQSTFQLNDNLQANIVIDGFELLISYHSDPVELLWLSVDLGRSPTAKRHLHQVMQHGFSHWALNRMTVALDEETNHLTAFNAIPVCNLNEHVFADVLKGFYQSLVQFSIMLNEVRAKEAQS